MNKNKSNNDRTNKIKIFSWKNLIIATIMAIFLNVFISAIAGVEPLKNLSWTIFWMYLTIGAWKFWKWKALLPYPTYLVSYLILFSVVSSSQFSNLFWPYISLAIALNISGLIIFSLLLYKSQQKQKITVETQKPLSDSSKNPAFKKLSIPKDNENLILNQVGNINSNCGLGKKAAAPSSAKSNKSKFEIKMKNEDPKNDNKLYEQIWKEIDQNKTDLGLWAKCFASCDGDEDKTKALYIKKRISGLKEKSQKQIIENQKSYKDHEIEASTVGNNASFIQAVSVKNDDLFRSDDCLQNLNAAEVDWLKSLNEQKLRELIYESNIRKEYAVCKIYLEWIIREYPKSRFIDFIARDRLAEVNVALGIPN